MNVVLVLAIGNKPNKEFKEELKMKKLLSLVLTFVLLCSVVPFGAIIADIAQVENPLDYLEYSVGESDVTITNCDTQISGSLEIPSEIENLPVTAIGDDAFYNCENLASVVIPNTVKTIGVGAFYSCSNLVNVTINDGVVNILEDAFYNCTALENIVIPKTVEKIGDSAFANCQNLESVTITNGVLQICENAFDSCTSLLEIIIPDSVTEIKKQAFFGCEALTAVTVGKGVETINESVFESCTKLQNVTLDANTKNIENSVFFNTQISNVYYNGTCSQNKNLTIGDYNESLQNANWILNDNYHSYSSTCTKPATCKEKGEMYHVCACGDSYTTEIPKTINHKNVTVLERKATLTVNGSLVTKCSVCGTVAKRTPIAKIASVTTTAKITYNGKTKTPAVVVKDANGRVISSSNYTVSYAKGRKNYGKYKITVTFKGNYSGSKVIYFEIVPKNSKASKLTAAKKSLKVKLSRQKKATGYQIQYSTSKTFKSAKTVTLKKNSITSKTIKKLKAKKTYYVRVRTYKTYKGKKYYSAWSAAKKKKTK